MPYYVPLGVRGLILRIGAVLSGWLGSAIYRRMARRRASAAVRRGDRPRTAA